MGERLMALVDRGRAPEVLDGVDRERAGRRVAGGGRADWWRHGGPTDIDNLLPVGQRHHQAVHRRGWRITLRPRRELTIHLPDGTTMATGPTTRNGP